MRSGEMRYVLGEIEASLPAGRRADDRQRESFARELLTLAYTPAMAAARRLKGEVDWFPSWAEFKRAYDSETERLRAQRAAKHADEECPECEGNVHVILRRDPFEVRPCSRCNPVLHQRWAEGHLASGHACAECADLRAGGLAAREARAALLARHRVVPLDEIRRAHAPTLDTVDVGELRRHVGSVVRRVDDELGS